MMIIITDWEVGKKHDFHVINIFQKQYKVKVKINQLPTAIRKAIKEFQQQTEEWSDGEIKVATYLVCRSQCPRRLRRRSETARLLRFWFRKPPGHGCMSIVSDVCCRVEVSATSWSLVQRSSTDCGAALCDIETSWMRKPWPTWGFCTKNKQTYIHTYKQTCLV